jgi:hypothetical protein
MKIPSFTRILVESLPSDVRKWVSALVDPLNSFMLSMKIGLNKGITINDNLAGAIKTLTVSGGAVEFAYGNNPKAVIIGNIVDLTTSGDAPTTGVGLSWGFTGTTIACTFHGLETGHKYNITLVIFED